MSKYIIKNCENLLYCTACKDYECALADEFPYKRRCSDNNNCNLKQIVENLKQVAYAGHCDNCDGCGYYNGCSDTECGTYQALKSLELLDIQDVE